MKINRETLRKALETVRPGLANKEGIVEQSTSFVFMRGKVVTFNDEISISYPVEGLDIEGALPADKLYPLLNKITKDDIEIIIDDTKKEIIITAGKMKAGIVLQPEIKLPLKEVAPTNEWKELPENFIRYMKFAAASCSKDLTRPLLTTVHVNKKGYIEATDSRRLTRCYLTEDLPVHTFLIPSSSVEDIVKFNPTKISEGAKGWIHFQTDDKVTISSRIFDEDQYVDITPLLQVEGEEVILPDVTREILDRAIVFAKREDVLEESIQMTLENKRLKLSSSSKQGWFEEEVNIRYKGNPISVLITPYLLKDILSETSRCVISENRIKFEGENWIYVAALLKK